MAQHQSPIFDLGVALCFEIAQATVAMLQYVMQLLASSRVPTTPDGLAQSVSTIDSRQIQQFNPGRLEDC